MKRTIIGLALLTSATSLWAQNMGMGGHDGGGGQGVVCYEAGKIKSVELLDFYEGRTLEDLKIAEYKGKYLDIYKEVVTKKAPSSRAKEYMEFASEMVKFTFMKKGERLKTIEDSGSFIIPAGCKIEQVANFQGVNRIFVVGDFWEKMSETNRAGLYMHEYIWTRERMNGVPKSIRARRTVARFFASNYEFGADPIEAKVGDLDCVAADDTNEEIQPTGFLISKIEGTNSCSLNFYNLNGERVFNKHNAVLENCDGFKFSEPQLQEQIDMGEFVLVRDANTNSMTHDISIDVSSRPVSDAPGYYERLYTVKVNNLEFPGISDKKPMQFLCNAGITEEDIQNPWW